MGGCLDYRVYETNDRTKIESEFSSSCEIAKVEDGISYPGTIAAMSGIATWRDKRFDTQNEAVEFLSAEHDKWDDAMAVSFLMPKPLGEKQKERVEQMRERAESWRERVRKAQRDAVDNFKARKSVTVGCSGCKSRLDHGKLAERAYTFANLNCPVCHTPLSSKPDQERVARLKQRVEKANEDLKQAQIPETTGQVAWIVGGWCSS